MIRVPLVPLPVVLFAIVRMRERVIGPQQILLVVLAPIVLFAAISTLPLCAPWLPRRTVLYAGVLIRLLTVLLIALPAHVWGHTTSGLLTERVLLLAHLFPAAVRLPEAIVRS